MNIHSVKPAAILDAALELFGERGYGGTPVPDVAQRARVAVGTIYRYFPGKEGVVNALYRHWKGALAAELFEAAQAGGAPQAVFERVWERLAAFASEHPDAFAFLETHHHGAYLDAESRTLGEAIDARMVALIGSWQAAGAVRSGDPAALLAQAFGGFVGVVRYLRAAGRPIPGDIGAQTRDAAWRGLAAPTPKRRRAS